MLTQKHNKRILSFVLAVLMFVNGSGMVFADNALKAKLKLIAETSSQDFSSKENVKLYEVATAEELLAVFKAYNNGTLDHATLFPKSKNDIPLDTESDNSDSVTEEDVDNTATSSEEAAITDDLQTEAEDNVTVAGEKDLLSVISAKSFSIPSLSTVTAADNLNANNDVSETEETPEEETVVPEEDGEDTSTPSVTAPETEAPETGNGNTEGTAVLPEEDKDEEDVVSNNEIVYIRLTADINLASLTEWEAIGTQALPFTGVIDGNGKTVSGITIGTQPFASLITYGENATIKNITVVPANIADIEAIENSNTDLYAALFSNGVNMTVVNCTVQPANIAKTFSLPMLLAGVTPDTTWYTPDPSPSSPILTFNITDASQIAGLAVLVNEGVQSFDGKTIILNNDVDLAVLGDSFQPIGTENNPFKGTFKGNSTTTWGRTTISNLNISQFGSTNVGFIGYGSGAVIEDINFQNCSTYGTSYTGTIAGTLTSSSKVINCAVSGNVSGAMYTGGLVGQINDSTITTSYSTASVSGSTSSGGIVGMIELGSLVENCFSTGDVSAASIAGGIAGTIKEVNGVNKCASSGTIRGSGLIGGIGGSGVREILPNGNTARINVIMNSYTTSSVYASSDSGGILGGVGDVNHSYTSGNITSANPSDGFIHLDVGYDGSAVSTYGRRDAVVGNTGKSTYGASFFSTNLTINSNFTTSAMMFSSSLPISGTYPQIKDFTNATVTPPEFQIFTEITTSVDLSVAKELYYGSSGYASTSAGGTNYVLPDLPAGSSWKIRYDGVVDNHADIPDATLTGDVNKITLETNATSWTIKMDEPLVTEATIKLVASTSVEGLEIFYEIVLKDQAVRVLSSSIPVYFHTDIADMGTNNFTISKYVNTFIISFPEKIVPIISTNPSPIATLVEYTGFDTLTGTFIGSPTTVASYGGTPAIELSDQNDSSLKIKWPSAVIKQERYYVLTVSNVKDSNGNTMAPQVYYLKTLPNIAPVISFMPTAYGVVSTNAAQDEQIIALTKGDENFVDCGQDILVEDEDIIIIDDANVISFTSTNPSATITNFQNTPGEHVLKYQVTDSGGLLSNIITRTYRISSDLEVEVSSGSPPVMVSTSLGKIECGLTNDDILTIAEDITHPTSPLTLEAALQNAILAKINLQAKQTSYDGTVINYDFKLNLESVTVQNLINDANFSTLTFDLIDPSTGTAIKTGEPISVTGGTGLKRILAVNFTKSSVSMSQDDFISTADIQTLIDPSVKYTKNNIISTLTDYTPVWSGTIDPTLTSPQILTFQATNIMGLGFDLPIKKIPVSFFSPNATVINPNPPATEKESETDNTDTFWQEIREKIEAAKPGETVTANVKYKNSYAPVTVFMALEKKDDVTLKMNFDKSVTVEIHSSDVDLSSCETSRWAYNVNIVPMENVYVTRFMATNGYLQQFYTLGKDLSYGTVTLSMPLDKGLADLKAAGKLSLYRFDTATHEYEFITKITDADIKNNVVSLRVEKLLGEYVIGDITPVPEPEVIKPNPGTGR